MPGSASLIGRIKVINQPSTSAPSNTVAAAAFGNATTAGAAGGGSNALSPGRAHGARFWLGVGSLVFLVWVYHNLPE